MSKYTIDALNPVSGKRESEHHVILFLIRDPKLIPMLIRYLSECVMIGADTAQVLGVSLLLNRAINYHYCKENGIPVDTTVPFDKKYRIQAINNSTEETHDEFDSMVFLIRDKALPAALSSYLHTCVAMNCDEAEIDGVLELIDWVSKYQLEHGSKIPDIVGEEIQRCIDSIAKH